MSTLSKINQNHIIAYLEDVIPQMQKSASAEDCLLKYAKEHNFSPAILERVGHMFNSLKVNSTYNLAKEASHRGDYVTTLDVPDLLNRYQNFMGDVNLDKLQLAMDNLYSTENTDTNLTQSFKLASSKGESSENKEGNISDLFLNNKTPQTDLAEEMVKAFHEYDAKVQEEESSMKKKAAAETTVEISPFKYLDSLKDKLQKFSDIREEYFNKIASVENEFKHLYATSGSIMPVAFNTLERDAIISYSGKDKEEFKESISKLASAIESVSSKIKLPRAKESDFKYVKIAKEIPSQQKTLEDYHEACESVKIANALINLTVNEIDKIDLTKPLIKVAASGTSTDIAAQLKALQDELKNSRLRQQKLLNSINTLSDKQKNLLRDNANILANKADIELSRGKKTDSSSSKSNLGEASAKAIDSVLETGDKFIGTAVNTPVVALNDLFTNVGRMYDLYEKTPQGISEKQQKALSKMKEVESKADLEELLYLDPILSKLDDDQTDQLLEVYNSIVNQNPSIAYDKGVLRNLLRRAVEVSGIDLGTANTLSTMNLSESKIK